MRSCAMPYFLKMTINQYHNIQNPFVILNCVNNLESMCGFLLKKHKKKEEKKAFDICKEHTSFLVLSERSLLMSWMGPPFGFM